MKNIIYRKRRVSDYNYFKSYRKTRFKDKISKYGREEQFDIYRYKNYSRKSGVYAFAISPDKTIIYVYFNGGSLYKYDISSAPEYAINNMVKRAKSGWGLNRYINKHKPDYYFKGKWR